VIVRYTFSKWPSEKAGRPSTVSVTVDPVGPITAVTGYYPIKARAGRVRQLLGLAKTRDARITVRAYTAKGVRSAAVTVMLRRR
jgi:hypothetical protein